MNFKKFTALTLAAMALSTTTAFADNINVVCDEKPITFQYAQPAIVNNRTLVPLRGVFDTMGYTISYDQNTKTATIANSTTVVKASADGMSYTQNGKTVTMNSDVKPQLINNYFMVPLRAVATVTGAEVDWQAESRTVIISTKKVENIQGKMPVAEKEYLEKVQQTTSNIKIFAANHQDTLLKNTLGLTENNVTELNDAAYYKTVTDSLNELKALEAPAAMSEVQALVESYVDNVSSVIAYASSGASYDEVTAKTLEASKALSTISQDFGVKLWNYFNANEVNFEKLYGDSILDALK